MDDLSAGLHQLVVTRATFWLARRPAASHQLVATIADTARLAPAIDALRSLLQTQVLVPHAATLWNSYKLAAHQGRYPWATALTPPLDILAREGAAPWILLSKLSGRQGRCKPDWRRIEAGSAYRRQPCACFRCRPCHEEDASGQIGHRAAQAGVGAHNMVFTRMTMRPARWSPLVPAGVGRFARHARPGGRVPALDRALRAHPRRRQR
ncbi:MAG: hypothetical protein QE285_01440 [Aquabacterium sp.]|nr:hypothetical protein [Aquabacterium sp.]